MADEDPRQEGADGEVPEPSISLDIDAPAQPPEVQPLPHLQEAARRRLAYYLVTILAVEVLASIAYLWCHSDQIEALKGWMTIVFGPTIALVGSAAGFYFGTAKVEQS
jgi:hypothetical protein